MKKKCSIVIPVYNEEAAIAEVIDSVHEAMRGSSCEYEILVVDDGSTDRTAEIVKTKDTRLVSHLENKGIGNARKTGIRESRHNIIVMIDGDGTYPAGDIPKLVEHIPPYDMVVGARKKEAGTMPLLRMPVKWFIRKVAEYITGKKIPDLNSGLRAFRKDVVLKFFSILPEGHSWVSTITIALFTNSYDIKYIPIEYHKRKGRSTFHPIKDTSAYFLLIFRTVMYFKPLKVFMPPGLILFVLGIIRTYYDARVLKHIKESDIIIIMISIFVMILGLIADLIVKRTGKQD